ncbi:MAG TPA: dTDP-4-dehydrorhamnose 3,5-epimerase [Sphingomicrobium sp.]|nr:dTDP-4-dehydrorhamnose 3,5-epimerase [Sphingomicrobium sp.]
MVEISELELEGVLELRPRRWPDERGSFSEVWRDDWLVVEGSSVRFVQDNHSFSRKRGVVRGLHYQRPPAAQHKLVRVTRGSVFDVAVDMRAASPTFGRWVGKTLSAAEWNQLFVPIGFAHGFVALEDETEVLYKVSAAYSPEHEQSVRFDDPTIAISWPVEGDALTVSPKDLAAPFLLDIDSGF